ncbi:glucosaminidase domain-containing protein, partial [Carnobacterium sp. ISL-102]|nr:glucosaminidase domain-containing protein [Carnobacterium sp. ISL-102]
MIKKGTAVFSTTLLVSLLAFPTFSVSASANDSAETSGVVLKDALEQNKYTDEEGTKVAVEASSKEKEYITEDSLGDKEKKINELKALISDEEFESLKVEYLDFENLSIEDIDDLIKNVPDIDTTAVVFSEGSYEEAVATTKTATEAIEAIEAIEATKTAEAATAVATTKTEEAAKTEAEAAKVEAAKVEAAKVEAAKVETAKVEAAKVEAAKVEAAKVEAAKIEAAKAEATKAAATTTAKTYTVKSGDTLNKISSANGVTVTQLKTWNKLSSDLILVGQVLALNEAAAKTVTVTTPVKTNEAIADATTPAGFVNAITSYAKQVAANNDLYASVMIAQAALESGYGTSKLSTSPNYNLFGIKGSYNGNTVTMYTSEWSSSTGWIYIPQNFKKYPSYAESLQDNANLLKRGTSWDNGYYAGAWVSNSDSAYEATAWLQGRYATDPTYASKLNSIINSYNLTQYDTKSSGAITQTTPVSNDNNVSAPSTGTTSSTSYAVKSGDTLTA